MDSALAMIAMASMLALSLCTFIALDVAMRPRHYVGTGKQGVLQSLSQRLLPRVEKPSAYRIIGLATAMLTFGAAMLIFGYEFSYFLTR